MLLLRFCHAPSQACFLQNVAPDDLGYLPTQKLRRDIHRHAAGDEGSGGQLAATAGRAGAQPGSECAGGALREAATGLDEHGRQAERSVVEIVDDMPFLVDSVTAELNQQGLTVHLAAHPVIRIVRDPEVHGVVPFNLSARRHGICRERTTLIRGRTALASKSWWTLSAWARTWHQGQNPRDDIDRPHRPTPKARDFRLQS